MDPSGQYARDAVAHVAEIGRSRTEVHVIGGSVLPDLRLHRIPPGLFRRRFSRDRDKRRLAQHGILEHGHLKGQHGLGIRIARALLERGELGACRVDGLPQARGITRPACRCPYAGPRPLQQAHQYAASKAWRSADSAQVDSRVGTRH